MSPGTATTGGPIPAPVRPATSSPPPRPTRSSARRSAGSLEQAWTALGRPVPFAVVEHGAGTGALAEGLLVALRDAGSPLFEAIRYRAVEVELARLEALRARLDAAGLGAALAARDPGDALADGEPAVGAVVANEVLDALPVHRVIGRPGGIREQLVGLDAAGGFAWVEADPTTAELAERLGDEGIELEDGQAAEVCLGVDDLARGRRRRPRPRGRRPRRLRGGARVPVRAEAARRAPCAGSPGTASAATRSATWGART